MFSIVIPLYNKEKTIARALRSVLNQTFQDFEIIVVNDGSTDGSVAEVKRFADPRIHVIEQPNGGVSAARNRGVAEAKADWVAFLDADDEWLAAFLQAAMRLGTAHQDCGFVATRYFTKTANGDLQPAVVSRVPQGYEGPLENYVDLLLHGEPPFCTGSVVVRRNLMLRIGGFPSDTPAGEDLVTWFKLSALQPIYYSMHPLVVYHQPSVGERRVRVAPHLDPLADEVRSFATRYGILKATATKQFLAHWFRIRAVTFLQVGDQTSALRFAIRSIRNYWQLKVALYVPFCLVPFGLGSRLFRLAKGNRPRHLEGQS